jgi:hypothetical protein
VHRPQDTLLQERIVVDGWNVLVRIQVVARLPVARDELAGIAVEFLSDPVGINYCGPAAHQSGSEKATYASPDFVPSFPPPAAITTYCFPRTE